MLAELSSTLDNYYRSPSSIKRNPKNLILVPIGNNNNREDIHENDLLTSKRMLNYNNRYIPIINKFPNFPSTPNDSNHAIISPNLYNNKQNVDYFYNDYNIPSDYLINNYNKHINIRPKSAIKTRKNINTNANNFSFNNIIRDGNKNKNKTKTNIKKISLIKKKDNINNNNIEEDYDINYNMNEFENIVKAINYNGFQKYQDTINDKKILIKELENSIAVLKNKICICKSNTYNGLHKETKNKIQYENMLCVSNRYKNIGQTADNYKNEINILQNKIENINNETMQIKSLSLNEQTYIDLLNEEIRKGNKAISDKQKEIENILPALQLLKNHIISVKQKILKFNNIKTNYIEELNNIENNI
jgi:hypothetical protein